MDSKVVSHFQKVDLTMYGLATKYSDIRLIKSTTYFTDLVEAIISQQLSEKAGSTIVKRFYELFPDGKVTPELVLQKSDAQIRERGPSWAKVAYIKNIAQAFLDGTIESAKLSSWSDAEVVEHLIRIKGVGFWTAEMFLMFTLARPDVFSAGDAGLVRAIKNLYKLKKDPTQKQLMKISRKWSPYRTYACRLLWKSLDNES